jgi:predicted Zn finger-like uncharacterized protein
MAATLTCPECAAVIDLDFPADGRKIRCPECDALFRPPAPEDHDILTAIVVDPIPVVQPVGRPRAYDNRLAARPIQRGHGGLLLALGLVLGGVALLLLAACGMGAFILLLPRGPGGADRPAVVAEADQGAVAREHVADGPKAVPPPAEQPPPAAAQLVVPAAPAVQPAVPPIDPGPPPEPGATSLPVTVLRAIKAATVFIKAETPTAQASGSGFLVRADGDSGYVVTNHHVIEAPDDDEEDFLPGPMMPFPRGPMPFPRRPFPFPRGPLMPHLRRQVTPTYTLVFWSGTPQQEKSVRGEVVASDKDVDLAVLRFRGVAGLPRPLDPRRQARLVETMPVFTFGFPFGQDLDPKKGNPAVTVGKAAVSSIRHDNRGEMSVVQIDGEVNPGNSGGPVVDAQGQLVGVTVAKIRNTRIGMAIPVPQVIRMLTGHVSKFAVSSGKVENGASRVQVTAWVVDPLRQLRGVALYHVRGNHGGQRTPLPGAQKSDMPVASDRATVQLSLPAEEKGDNAYSFQVAVVTGDGQTRLTPALLVHVGATPAPPPKPPQAAAPANPPAPPQRRPLTGAELDQALKDLQGTDGFARTRAAQLLAGAEPKERRAEVARVLEALLKTNDMWARAEVAKALGTWGTKDSVPPLLALLKDPAQFVQWGALEALAQLKDERAVEPVAECLPNIHNRERAAKALRAIGAPAEKAVLKYITHQDTFVRVEVCNILKEIGTKASVEALQKATQDQPFVGPAAKQALEAIQARR